MGSVQNCVWYHPDFYGIINTKATVMTNEEIIAKIDKILTKVHDAFNQANTHAMRDFEEAPDKYKYEQDEHGLRNWWLDKYRAARNDEQINMFSFNADDIIKLKIPSKVVGCSGRADLFAKYANEMDLDVNIVAMVRTDEKDKDKPNGHQIIAVKFPDGSQQLIDPGLAENYQAAKVDGNCALGTEIIIPGQPKYEIRAILTPDTHAKIDSQEKLAQVYKNPQIKPETPEILTAINTIVNELQNPKTGLNSLSTNIMNSLNGKELEQLNKAIKNKIGRSNEIEINQLQYIKIILQRFVIVMSPVVKGEKGTQKELFESLRKDGYIRIKVDGEIKDLSEDQLLEIIDNHNNVREALNGKPEIFMKYGISPSCSNAATAFIHEFGERYEDQKVKLRFLDTTRWDHLLDGGVGHVVPCIQIGDDDNGDWIMIEPLHETIDVGISTKIIPNSDFGQYKPLEHLIAHHKGEPYMITAISKEPCTDHQKFLEHVSRVKLEDAKKFLAQVAEEEYWSDMHTKIKRESDILSDLNEEEKKLPPEELQYRIECKRRTQLLQSVTEKLDKQVQCRPYVNMEELKQAQAQQASFDY